ILKYLQINSDINCSNIKRLTIIRRYLEVSFVYKRSHLHWGTCYLLAAVSCQERPILMPQENEIIKHAGSSIDFTCTGSRKIFFFYPTNYGSDEETSEQIISSEIEVEEFFKDYKYIYNFRRSKAVPGDTGWYGCSYRNITITRKEYDNPEISWAYVYVDSPDSSFVENVVKTIKGITGNMALIPCRPTLPSLKVILIDQFDEVVEIGENISYDPKFGYTIDHLSLHDNGLFRCSITRNNETYEVNYHLDVFSKQDLSEPKIIKDTLRHVVRGQTLHVNCTIDLKERSIPFQLNWRTPIESQRISTHLHPIKTKLNLMHVTSELIIQNVTEEDEGEYECIIIVNGGTNSAKMNLTIHDPNKKYINLTSQDPNRRNVRKNYSNVMFDHNGHEILDDWSNPEITKYAINKTPTKTILRINRLEIEDMGVYTLEATNDYTNKSLNFTLSVLAKPALLFKEIESYYSPGQIVEIHCYVIAFPEPEISWSFLQCPNYPSQWNSSLIELTHMTEVQQKLFFSKATMEIEASGFINCTACNSEGCDSTISNIIVSDGNGGFSIIEPKEPIVEGDDIEIICAASIYNYTKNIQWQDNNDKPILEDERIQVILKTTPFTYRAILQIKNVNMNDTMIYNCIGETQDGNKENLEYNLLVYRQKKPSFTNVNLNETDLIVDFGTENHKLIILKCFVDAMPKAKVTWYKDNIRLKSNEQYELKYDEQELHIKYVFEHDSGKYSCKAENRLGREEAYQNIMIKGKELPKGLIILIVVLFIVVVILIVYFTIKVRREKIMRKELLETGLMHFEEGALECLNPELTVDDQAELLPYDKKWEFPRERLKLGIDLLTRTASMSSNNSISANSGTEMVQYYAHNTTDSQGVSMSPDGCILSNNSSQPGWRSNYRGDYKDHNLKPICTQDLLSWAFQVARGMEYLSQRRVSNQNLYQLYNIMLQCWKAKPTLRPSFTELVDSIGDLLEESVRTHYISLNTPYMDMNTMILDGKNDYLTMMSAPDHAALSLPMGDYVNSPILENAPESAYLCMSPTNHGDESGIFSPRPNSEKSRFEFPLVTSDSEDAVELSPMLKNVEDPYLKPINVHERRAEFARQRQAASSHSIDRINERDSGYCNTPRNLHLIDLNEKSREKDQEEEEEEQDEDRTDSILKKKEYTPSIIRTQDNYVNMPKQKNDLKRDMPDGFSNPSYVMMGNELNQSVA
ncbi:vascular endothelial growth factor receptor 1 isoform X1, partial [Vespula squamosa]